MAKTETKNMNAGVKPCGDVAARVIDNVSKTGPLTYKPTTMAVAFVNAAVAYQCRGSNA